MLASLFNKSKFAAQQEHTNPTELDIFDFDSTLFMSPYMSPRMWSKSLNRLTLAEGAIGPGWWRDLNSLTLGDTNALQQSAWDSYWNDEVVEKARLSIQDPNKLTVMLTGRRFHPFGRVIPQMLEAKGLMFDIVALRPDPEYLIENGTVFNYSPSVFNNTMDFKRSFILDLFKRIPSIRTMVMYDDRKHHVTKFEDWMRTLIHKRMLDNGEVHFVTGDQRGFDPGRELACMQRIVDEHNRRVEIRRKHNEQPPTDVEDRIAVETWWRRKAKLKPIVSSLNIKFTDSEIAKLPEIVEAVVDSGTLQNAKRFPFVGQEVELATAEPETPLADSLVALGTDRRTVELKLGSIGEIAPDGIGVEAVIQDNQLYTKDLGLNSLYIPLWCRPALMHQAADGYRKIWEPSNSAPTILSGCFCLGYTYDIEGDPPVEGRPHYKSYNDQHHHHHNRSRDAAKDRKKNWPYNENNRRHRK